MFGSVKLGVSVACLLLTVSAGAKDFLGLYTTDSIPGMKCKAAESAPKFRQGNYLGSRSDAYHKVNEALDLFVTEIKQDGYDAVVGFRPAVTGAVSGDATLFTWFFAGVAVKCGK
ncbi:MAG: hypothetical protein EKK59_03075 [Neisseriaceae bacterium]|nr:MAG: hypothetical protein EKK59_03075 [Neisseriaceae bacterium]